MRTRLLLLAGSVIVVLFAGCSAPVVRGPSQPVIIVSQTPGYPMPGYDSEFHWGLVAKLWRDGRMIRATRLDTVGKCYVEGFVVPASRERFFTSLGASAAMQLPEGGDLIVDSASETITVRRDGKTSKWYRTLPDKHSVWRDFESRLMDLPLADSRNLDLKEVELMSRNE